MDRVPRVVANIGKANSDNQDRRTTPEKAEKTKTPKP